MYATQGFELWWLIPLILIGLCLLCMRSCCCGGGRRRRSDVETGANNKTDSPANQGERQ